MVLSVGATCCGILCRKFCDKVNAENFADFLTGACKEYWPFVMFLDASCRKPNEMNLLLGRIGGKIQVHCFPPYTPGLNPAELQWRSLMAKDRRLYGGTGGM